MGRLRLIFLQGSETEASVLHAVIALGALDQTSQTAPPDSALSMGGSVYAIPAQLGLWVGCS
jgi:hypothetical protein